MLCRPDHIRLIRANIHFIQIHKIHVPCIRISDRVKLERIPQVAERGVQLVPCPDTYGQTAICNLHDRPEVILGVGDEATRHGAFELVVPQRPATP